MIKRKKGFTLVELLVVIAILAILVLVSVVGYSSLTEKAIKSNDLVLLTQMNLVLKANEAFEREWNMKSAIEQINESGLDYEHIMPASSNVRLAYDSSVNRFAFLTKKYQTFLEDPDNPISERNYDIFVVVNDIFDMVKLEGKGYSVYLNDDFDEEYLECNSGIDIGNNTNIKRIRFQSLGDNNVIVIRTYNTDCKLYVEGEDAYFYHYGIVGDVYVLATNIYGYHEFGVVENLYQTNGDVYVESSAVIKNLVRKDYEKDLDVIQIGARELNEDSQVIIRGGIIVNQ